jgi:hypothetical protein
MRSWSIACLGALALTAPLVHETVLARAGTGSACASDSLTEHELVVSFLPSVMFERDSSGLDFVPAGKPSNLARRARRITTPRLCRLAHRAFMRALGGDQANPSEPKPGTVSVVRIGSYYLIMEADAFEMVLTTRDWRVLSIIGFDND